MRDALLLVAGKFDWSNIAFVFTFLALMLCVWMRWRVLRSFGRAVDSSRALNEHSPSARKIADRAMLMFMTTAAGFVALRVAGAFSTSVEDWLLIGAGMLIDAALVLGSAVFAEITVRRFRVALLWNMGEILDRDQGMVSGRAAVVRRAEKQDVDA